MRESAVISWGLKCSPGMEEDFFLIQPHTLSFEGGEEVLAECTTADIAPSPHSHPIFRLEVVLRPAVPAASAIESDSLPFMTTRIEVEMGIIIQTEVVKGWSYVAYVIQAPLVG